MTSKGPTNSPPRSVVAHRSHEEADRVRDPRDQTHSRVYQPQHLEQQQRTGKRENREIRNDTIDLDDRDERRTRDNRSEWDKSNNRSRKVSDAGGDSKSGGLLQLQEPVRRSSSRDRRETGRRPSSRRDQRRERDRERNTDRLEATAAGIDATRDQAERGRYQGSLKSSDHTDPSAKSGKRPRSPGAPFDYTSAGGGKRARQDSSPYRHSQYKRQSSRSPPPQSASSSQRERRSRHKPRDRADHAFDKSETVIGGLPRGRDEEREQKRHRERDRGRDRERDRDYKREQDQDKARDRGRERQRDGDRGREGKQKRDRDQDRGRGREKEREREGDRERHGRSPLSSKKSNRQRRNSQASLASDAEAHNPKSPIDDDMTARGGTFRTGSVPGPYGKGQDHIQQQYQQSQNLQHDLQRRQLQYPHSHHHPQSGQATPNSPYRGSQPNQSPYGGSQGWGQGQKQLPPQGQYPQPLRNKFSPNGTPHGRAAHHQANSPPYGAPLGPGGQYGNLRAKQHGSVRADHRNSIGNGANGSHNGQQSPDQGAPFEGDHHTSPKSVSPHPGNHQHHRNNRHGSNQPPPFQGQNTIMQDSEAVISRKRRLHAADEGHFSHSDRSRQNSRLSSTADDQMPPPSNRQPPTGPQSKFSFAFKNVPKPPVTAPKAEIAQKLSSAALKPLQQQEQELRQDVPPSSQQQGQISDSTLQSSDNQPEIRSAEIARSDFPVGAPTEPAFIRARSEQQRHRAEANNQQQQTRGGPRYHKVKQIVRRPKARPTLPDDLAASESVYYRKPGNESVVGAGTYGKVFKAVHVYTKKLVALKRIRMDGEREGLPVTAIREIKLLQSLRHPNVVDLLEVMVEGNNCFMVFEYLSHDLNGLLNHPTFQMNAAQKKHMALQLFQGLDYLHRRGVLHRDIKAANILVSNTGVLKLADFGLARFFAKHHKLDYSNRVITIWYRSPELLLGETRYGPAVDIWSAACVLGEIFTHKPVFPSNGGEIGQINKIYGVLGTPSKHDWPELTDMPWFELLRPEIRMPSIFAEKYQKHLTPAAFDVLRSMFHYDPAKRPTAGQVLEHAYFTQEEPAPRQAIELAEIGGEWHEFESKALRRQTEIAKKASDTRKTAVPPALNVTAGNEAGKEDKKRPAEADPDSAETGNVVQREVKRRLHTETLRDQPANSPTVGAKEKAEKEAAAVAGTVAATEVAAISPPPPPEPELGQPLHLAGTVQQ